MTDLITRLCSSDDPDKLEAADTIEALQERVKVLEEHFGRVLYLHQGCWHENSIFQQEYAGEIEAARAALKGGERCRG